MKNGTKICLAVTNVQDSFIDSSGKKVDYEKHHLHFVEYYEGQFVCSAIPVKFEIPEDAIGKYIELIVNYDPIKRTYKTEGIKIYNEAGLNLKYEKEEV